MKSASSISLSKTWWKKEAPEGLKKSGTGFEKALVAFETAHNAFTKAPTEESAKVLEKALDGLAAAGKSVSTEAKDLEKKAKDKKAKADLANTQAVMLKPLAKEIASERKKTSSALDAASEEDDADGAFASPEAHTAYLKKWAPKIRKRTVSFALGLPSNKPEDMRFHFHPKKAGRSLAGVLKKEAGAKKFTFGKAGTDLLAEDIESDDEVAGRTLCLYVEGRQIPGLAKRVRLMLKALQVPTFAKVRILVEGEEVDGAAEEDADDTIDVLDLDIDIGDDDLDPAHKQDVAEAVPPGATATAEPTATTDIAAVREQIFVRLDALAETAPSGAGSPVDRFRTLLDKLSSKDALARLSASIDRVADNGGVVPPASGEGRPPPGQISVTIHAIHREG